MFEHVTIEIPKLQRIDGPNGRVYATPTGEKYPSVTTVLGSKPNEALKEWRQRVGKEEARRVSSRAARNGTDFHTMCESFLNNEYEPGDNLASQMMFSGIKPILKKCVNKVHALETPLFSHHLRTAGTVDCVAEFDGVLSVIDFKTSAREKKRSWIKAYFMQEAFYAVAFEELTRIPIRRLVTIIGVLDGQPQLFIEDRNSHIHDFIELREEFDLLRSNP